MALRQQSIVNWDFEPLLNNHEPRSDSPVSRIPEPAILRALAWNSCRRWNRHV